MNLKKKKRKKLYLTTGYRKECTERVRLIYFYSPKKTRYSHFPFYFHINYNNFYSQWELEENNFYIKNLQLLSIVSRHSINFIK